MTVPRTGLNPSRCGSARTCTCHVVARRRLVTIKRWRQQVACLPPSSDWPKARLCKEIATYPLPIGQAAFLAAFEQSIDCSNRHAFQVIVRWRFAPRVRYNSRRRTRSPMFTSGT